MTKLIEEVTKDVLASQDKKRAEALKRFFKTGKGEYAEGDQFVGLTVPVTRGLVKKWKDLPLPDIAQLLTSSIHEERLLALLLLVKRYPTETNEIREEIYKLYLSHTKYINNWDLVDVSADHIVGAHLDGKGTTVLIKLAQSKLLWDRRIAMLSCFHYIKQKRHKEAFEIATILLHDTHDLIHKAVGWMLREVGKRCGEEIEEEFLKEYGKEMPRTMLRYAIERFQEEKRLSYLRAK